MKNILLFILGALMAVLWTETTRAQSPGVIKITTARNVGDPIRMLISSSENVTLDGVNGTWVNGNSVTYVLTKKTVTITGNVKGFDCWYQLSDLTTLDASNCPTLETLNCGSNQLASLNVSGCTNLRTLHCANNRLTQLDLSTSGGERFWSLSCSNNQLKTLDVSACYKLMKLICERNQIKEEGMDQLIASLPDRSAMNLKGQLWLIDHTQNDEGNVCTTAQVAAAKARGWIPKEYNGSVWVDYLGSSPASVITMTTDKTVGQTIVLTFLENEAEHVTVSGATLTQSSTNNGYRSNTYTLTEQNITVTGNITRLRCNRNQLTALDVSGNTALTELKCGSNKLTELDLSNNTALTELYCGENRLSRINVSLNTQLTSLLCGDNPLTTGLDVSTNTLLVELYCQNCQLSALDLSNNTRLSILECSDNQLATINLSNNINLVELICGGNKLTELDVSKNTKLHAIACSDNLLTRLDLSKTDVWGVYCARNQIKDEAMDRLIASLPNRVGQIPQCRIGIYDNTQSDEGNVCTTVQVAASKARGWIPQEHIGNWQWIDYNGSDPGQLPTLSVLPATLNFAAAGEGKTLTVTSNTSWKAVSSADWLTLSAGSGANDGSITATAAANEATSVRAATVTFTADTVTRIVTVTQAAATPPAPTLSVSPATLEFVAAGEGKKLTVTSNTSWKAVSSAAWLTLSAGSGTNDGSITATAAANEATSVRTATITFTADTVTRIVTVTQAAASAPPPPPAPTLSVSPTTLEFVAAGEGKELTVTSNTSWKAVSSAAWLTLSAGSGTNDGSITATAAANEATSGRKATITFTADTVTRIVTVTQAAATPPPPPAPMLSVSPTTLEFVAAGEGKTLTVTSNTSWTAVSSAAWLTLSAGSGTNDGSITATAAANTETTPRETTITFTAGELIQTVTVTQAAATPPPPPAPTLSVLPATLNFAAAGEGKTLTVTSNTSWTAVSSADWLTLSAASGTNDGSITATAAANEATSVRKATITFTADTVTRIVTVTQAAATPPAPTLSVSLATLEFVAAGEGKELTVTSNTSWTAVSSADWLTLSAASGTNDGSIMATAKANTETTPRETTITFTAGELTQTVTVTQAGAEIVYVSQLILNHTSLEINGEASVQLRVTVLPAHATDPSVTWSSSNPSVASVDGNGLVTIRKKGKVRITVSANDGSGVSTHCDIEVISTVANEEVSAQNVYAYGGRLYLTLSRSEQVRIYHLNGQLLHVFRAPEGDTSLPLEHGFYVVHIGRKVFQVMVK